MPVEVTCDDTQKVHVQMTVDGKLDGPPSWEVVSGQGTVVPDPDGMGAYLVSEDNVQGDGPFDTRYMVFAQAGGAEVAGDNELILHVNNNPATALGFSVGQPEPK